MNIKTKIFATLLVACAAYNANALETFVRPSLSYVKPSTEGYSGELAVGSFAGVLLGDEAQHELSGDFSYAKWEYRQAGGTATEKRIPVLANYRYHVPGTDQLKNVRFYIGPSVGATLQDISVDITPTLRGSGSDWAFSWGGSAGFLVKAFKNVDVDVGYRTLTTGGTSYTFRDRENANISARIQVKKSRADIFYCSIGVGF